MPSSVTRLSGSSRPAVVLSMLLLGAAGAVVSVPTSTASAQEAVANRVDPYVVVFTANEVPVRAGSSIIYYPIVFPKAGDTLVVDGETTGWLRVMYPANVRALVMGEEAQEVGAGTVRLTRASKLKAPNANSGVKGAFLGVQETELPIGTEFKVVDTIKDDNGNVTFYAVEAPTTARGWISRDAVRRASDTEAAPVLAKLSTGPAGSPINPNGSAVKVDAPAAATNETVKTVAPTVPTASPAVTTAAPDQPSTNPPAPVQPVALNPQPKVEPVQIPTVAPSPTAPATEVGQPATPVTTPPGMEIPATVPVGDKDSAGSVSGAGGTRATQQGTIPVGSVTTVDGLKDLYNRVRAQPPESAELDAAIAEFERFKSRLSNTAYDQAIAKQLDAYTAVMKMRKEVRDAQNANASLSRDTELMKTEVGKRVIELEKQRVYTLIGRLVRSTVYDGGRAPVLYRVMSPEPGSARTLGYLLPDPKFDYANKLEQVVGIIGELRPDESLRTNLIVPKRVDVVSLAPIVVSPDIPGVVVPRGNAENPAPAPSPSAPAVPSSPAPEMPKLPGQTPPAVAPAMPAPQGEPEKP